MSRRALAAVASALAFVPAAHVASVPASEVRVLARQAEHDPRALARLRRVDVVGGRPMSIAALLEARGAVLEARLRALAAGGSAQPQAHPATDARQILEQRRFRGSRVPQPLHGALAWLGRKLDRPFGWLSRQVPGGPDALWTILAVAVAALASAVTVWFGRQRGGLRIEGRAGDLAGGREEDPAQLERAADEAERAGDLAAALRLRFRAGLVRLARARVIPARSSVTTNEVRAAVRSADFDELARTFDEVAYGRRVARHDDLERARATWPRVLDTVRGR